jgi:hypothetical protein
MCSIVREMNWPHEPPGWNEASILHGWKKESKKMPAPYLL